MQPKYPLFVPSKGRWESRLTMRALDEIGMPFTAVVEEQEHDAYAAVIGERRLLVLPHRDKGLVVTRNWIWDHAQSMGTPWFWTMDDNIRSFYRYNRNRKIRVADGSMFRAMEDFTARYENVPISGPNYEQFVPHNSAVPPFIANTRVYSCMLIKTDAVDSKGKPFRNEGFYNDDTDLCLRVLKDRQCTILFNAFLIKKSTTMVVKGGMTPHYQGDGRWKMAEELRRKHPDVTTVTRKWGRWQHHVDYRPFRMNPLRRKAGLDLPAENNEFGMQLTKKAVDESGKAS